MLFIRGHDWCGDYPDMADMAHKLLIVTIVVVNASRLSSPSEVAQSLSS